MFGFPEKSISAIIIFLILYFLFATLSQLTLFLSLFYFYPSLITVTNILNPLLFWIFSTIFFGTSTIENILNPIGYLITLISTLIYNELIIFNCYDLNKDTKKYVNKRINEELEEIKMNEEIFKSVTDDDSLMIDNNW